MSVDSKALVSQAQTSLYPSPQEWQTMASMADALVKSGMLPQHIKTPQAALAIMLKGKELGIPAMHALSNISVINGKPTCNSELMLALVYRDHGDEALQIAETTPQTCTASYKRRSWAARQSYSFTMADAAKAGLADSATWKKYPAAMLRARCISAVARMAFPDSIGGLYTPEELGATVDVQNGDQVVIHDVTPQPAAIAAPPTEDDEAAKRRLAVEIQDLCAKIGHDVPASTRDWVTLGTDVGLPAITKASQMSVEWFEQIKARLKPAGKSTAYVKWESVIAKATARHEVIAALEDAALELDADESAQLDKLGEARFESLPEEELVEA